MKHLDTKPRYSALVKGLERGDRVRVIDMFGFTYVARYVRDHGDTLELTFENTAETMRLSLATYRVEILGGPASANRTIVRY